MSIQSTFQPPKRTAGTLAGIRNTAAVLASSAMTSLAGTYLQSFDAADGTTNFNDGSFLASDSEPGLPGQAQALGNQLQLTADGFALEHASFRLPPVQGTAEGWTAAFDFTIVDSRDGTNPGEGFSFNYGAIPAYVAGAQGGLTAPDAHGSAEEGWLGVPHISFQVDTAQPAGAVDRGVAITYDGVPAAVTNGVILDEGTTVSGTVIITYHPVLGASFETTGLLTNADFSNIQDPVFRASDSMVFAFGARTSDSTETVLINNLVVTTFVDDMDLDGLLDSWETANGLDPTDATGDNGAEGDPDGDGVNNRKEFNLGSDPNNRDTDGDLFTDGDEDRFGTDPTDPNDTPSLLDGLISFYGFGTSSLDDVFADNDAIPSGPVPPVFAEGVRGMAAQLSGIDEFLILSKSDGPDFDFSETGFAISLQVKIEDFTARDQVILAKGDNLVVRRHGNSNSLQLVLDGRPFPADPTGTDARAGIDDEFVFVYLAWSPAGGARFSVRGEPELLFPNATYTNSRSRMTIGASALNPAQTSTPMIVDNLGIYNSAMSFDLIPGGGQAAAGAINPDSACHPKGPQIAAVITHDWVANEVTIIYPAEANTTYFIESSTTWFNPMFGKIDKALKSWDWSDTVFAGTAGMKSKTYSVPATTFVEVYRIFKCPVAD